MQSEYINGSEHIFSQGVETSPFSGKNVTILINGGTASAAEILAGVIKEYLPNTEIVGEQSYGK